MNPTGKTTMGIRRSGVFAAALAGAVAMAACDGFGPERPSGVTILLTDAPGDVAEAQVKVDGIYLQGDGGRTWLLEEQTGWIDLLTLAGTNTATLVEDAVVPEGRYHQLRFIIREAYVVDNDGNVFATQQAELPAGVSATGNLQCAACATPAGLRVNLPDGGVDIGADARILVVDFDVYESLDGPGRAGNSGQWVMTPLLRATDFAASATLTGTVDLAEGVAFPETCGGAEPGITHFIPRLMDADEVVGTGSTDEEGNWRMAFVRPGSYTLTHASEVEFEGASLQVDATATPSEITLGSGGAATAAFVIDALECVEQEEDEEEEA